MKKGLFTWGYMLDKIPGPVPFVNGVSHCSLETAADYLGAEGAVYMNSMHDLSLEFPSEPHMERLGKFKNVVCALLNDMPKMAESAAKISKLSLKYKNISGAVIDDFLDRNGVTEKMSPEELKAVSEALKKENPGLKLYVVRYTWQDQNELIPYLEHFDVINLWVWVSTEHYWRAEYAPELDRIKKLTGKPVIQGLFLHNYGETWNNGDKPVALDLVQLQCQKVFPKVRDSSLEGCIVLQNGWFDRNDHREQLQWLKDYLEWFYGTTTWG